MAEEKTILTVDLYDNVLTEKTGDFTGKIRITGTTNLRHLEPHREETHRVPPGDDHQHPRPLLRRDDRGPRPRPLRGEQVRAMAAHYQRLVRRKEIRLPLYGE